MPRLSIRKVSGSPNTPPYNRPSLSAPTVNAESGYDICDTNGCGTFLRVSKFPYENAIEDITHHLEVRECEFAVLDIPANPQDRKTLFILAHHALFAAQVR
jgi:hypothetical protein